MAKRDWYKIIDEAIEKQERAKYLGVDLEGGVFSEEDKMASGAWPDCACGVQDPRIPRFKRDSNKHAAGEPKDPELLDLGCEFASAVAHDHPYLAGYILGKIDRRSGEILARQAARKRAKNLKARAVK